MSCYMDQNEASASLFLLKSLQPFCQAQQCLPSSSEGDWATGPILSLCTSFPHPPTDRSLLREGAYLQPSPSLTIQQLRGGYSHELPPFNGFLCSALPDAADRAVLEEEKASLLRTREIMMVPQGLLTTGANIQYVQDDSARSGQF